ncbi:hypothetical protein JCM1393_21300 [Clostridium carnis]
MYKCELCNGDSNSWIHCNKYKLVCDKCCGKCKYLDYSTSFIRCTYKNKHITKTMW